MRVLAISHTDPERGEAHIFGLGTLVGVAVPHEAVGPMASMAVAEGLEVPVIKLDDGNVVYGCECWWGDMEEGEKRIAGMVRVAVDVKEWRAGYERRAAEHLGVGG